MCLWKWCVEGWVIVSIVGGILFVSMVRGCSNNSLEEEKLEQQKIVEMAKAGLQQKVVSGTHIHQRTIWVKAHDTEAVEYNDGE